MPVAVDVMLWRLGRLDGAFYEKPLVDRLWPVYMDALSLGKSRHEIFGWHPFADGGRESTQVFSMHKSLDRSEVLLGIPTLAHS